MKKTFLFIMLSALTHIIFAQEKRALIIGIDEYTPPANEKATSQYRSVFRNLEGCRNDALSVKSVITAKYGFEEKNIDSLFNTSATHKNIINAMQQLLASSKPNDIAFIFYAGHGSQVNNSLSKETDKKDETIVPSDIWKDTIKDIRDKELSAIFNAFIDKGVELTVVMDCCHSGSISRGPELNPPKFRYLDIANYDAKDASAPTPPETRNNSNFLIMSAAQDVELASEQFDDNNVPHGAFTLALLQAINQQSVDASAMNLFSAARAILKANGKKQEPVLGGSIERQNETLFGIKKGLLPDKILVPVLENKNSKITLQAGFALSLNKDNELIHVENNDTVKLRIDSIISINKSLASIIKGDAKNIKAGELFEVSNWVSSDAPLLKLYIPETKFSFAEIQKFAAINNALKKQQQIKWTNNLEKVNPYASVFFVNDKFYANSNGKLEEVKSFNQQTVLSYTKKDSSLYVEIPPTANLTSAIKNRFKENSSIQIVHDVNQANYMLYGTIDENGNPAYGLRRVQTSADDSLESMPVQTKYFNLKDADANLTLADSIYEYAMRLSKIKGWLQLVTPSGTSSKFPFHLEIFNSETGKQIDTFTYKIGGQMSLHLVANENAAGMSMPKKYVYVFSIDRSGNMQSDYPGEDEGNVNNRFPKYDNDNLIRDFSLFDYEVSEPAGTDNFFLLASDEPITNYAMLFNQSGVRGITEDGNPLSKLLNLGNDNGTRGLRQLPLNWCLLKLSVKSTH